jgi:hypothetical protein
MFGGWIYSCMLAFLQVSWLASACHKSRSGDLEKESAPKTPCAPGREQSLEPPEQANSHSRHFLGKERESGGQCLAGSQHPMCVESYQMANFGGQISFPSWLGGSGVSVLVPSLFWVGRGSLPLSLLGGSGFSRIQRSLRRNNFSCHPSCQDFHKDRQFRSDESRRVELVEGMRR